MNIEPRIIPPDEARRLSSLYLKIPPVDQMSRDALLDLVHTAAVLGEQRKAVLALHQPAAGIEWCRECRHSAPCPTARALGVTQ